MKVAVITVSDKVNSGECEDVAGPELEAVFLAMVPNVMVARSIIPCEHDAIIAEFDSFKKEKCSFIFTIGGSGPAFVDIVPETTLEYLDCEVPGIEEYLRAELIKETKKAVFYRGVAGLSDATYIINIPGALKDARFGATLLAPLLELGNNLVNK